MCPSSDACLVPAAKRLFSPSEYAMLGVSISRPSGPLCVPLCVLWTDYDDATEGATVWPSQGLK
jgi:hypothetical protein